MKNRFFQQDGVSRAFGTDLGPILGHLGSQKGAQEGPQTGPKTIKKEHKNQHEIGKRPGVPQHQVTVVVWVAQAPQKALPGSPGSEITENKHILIKQSSKGSLQYDQGNIIKEYNQGKLCWGSDTPWAKGPANFENMKNMFLASSPF